MLGVVVYFWLADEPETAYYLSQQERDLMVVRKRRQIGHTASGDQMHKEDVYKAFKDWKIWMFAFGQFAVDTILYGYSTFLPTIIKGLGDWSTAEIQALTIPCYALGAITYLVVAHFSDKYQQRGAAAVTFCIVTVVGYGILLADASEGVHYFGCFVVATGEYFETSHEVRLIIGRLVRLCWHPARLAAQQSASIWEANNRRWNAVDYREYGWNHGSLSL